MSRYDICIRPLSYHRKPRSEALMRREKAAVSEPEDGPVE